MSFYGQTVELIVYSPSLDDQTTSPATSEISDSIEFDNIDYFDLNGDAHNVVEAQVDISESQISYLTLEGPGNFHDVPSDGFNGLFFSFSDYNIRSAVFIPSLNSLNAPDAFLSYTSNSVAVNFDDLPFDLNVGWVVQISFSKTGSDGSDVLSGGLGDDLLRGLNGNDDLNGSDGLDELFGEAGNDVLTGGRGADQLDGGTGFDFADYEESSVGVTVNLATGRGSFGDAGGDTLVSIENLTGSRHADTLLGSGAANILRGGAEGDDLRGFAGNDRLFGEDGNDFLLGGLGGDLLDGGTGYDFASYDGSNTGVTVNLTSGIGAFGHAAGDTLTSVEHLIGSDFSDTLLGDGANNILRGGNGNDDIRGYAGNDLLFGGNGNDALFGYFGNDTLSGEAGNDTLSGGVGSDTVSGGTGNDTIVGDADGANDSYDGDAGNDAVDYSAVTTTIGVNLNTGVASGSAIGIDSLAGIERVFAGSGNDSLVASADSFLIDGGAGNDTILGGSGANILVGGLGNDIMRGFAGNDRLNGGSGNDRLEGNAGNDVFIFANGFGTDVVVDFDEFSNVEKIDLSAVTAITSFVDLAANHLTQVGANAVITDGANTITLNDVLIADLDANDFLF